MRQHQTSFSLYGFIIALLIHIIVFLFILMLEKILPIPPKPTEKEQNESRFKVSLKDQPKALNEALVKNDIPKITQARPLPKGEQLDKPTPPKVSQKSVQKPKIETPAPTSKPSTPPTPVEPPKKAFERHVAKEVATIERKPQPKKEFNLYDSLSKADNTPATSTSADSYKVSDSIQKLYGDKFGELSEGEQKYILDNQELMRRITQGVLNRYGRSRIPDNLRADEMNTVEFYLHPDGSISNLHFLKNSRFAILDDTTQETIEIAYSKYPRPEQKTLIRYRVWYNLN